MGTLAAERAILAEVLAMRTILLNFMLKVGEGNPIPEAASKKLIEWADANKMKRALEVLAKSSARGVLATAAAQAVEARVRRSSLGRCRVFLDVRFDRMCQFAMLHLQIQKSFATRVLDDLTVCG